MRRHPIAAAHDAGAVLSRKCSAFIQVGLDTLPGRMVAGSTRAWSAWIVYPDILTRAFEHGQTVSFLVLLPLIFDTEL